ncbi:hypothetical protein L484_026549 [Morus notabilis]|uniref:Uncharacterized protein n=1 Tax=Morus notabilis TaxID=981085 RepID=W9QNX7_9ROSA|nr:hypothetical protein L484_026549 [Morus notabilis]
MGIAERMSHNNQLIDLALVLFDLSVSDNARTMCLACGRTWCSNQVVGLFGSGALFVVESDVRPVRLFGTMVGPNPRPVQPSVQFVLLLVGTSAWPVLPIMK